MKTLLTMQSLPLLLLLLQPLPLQVFGLPDDVAEEFEDYKDELYSTGPTKPPTKESFQKHVIIPPRFPLYNEYDCTYEMLFRNVHDRFYCRKDHFFLAVAYDDLQWACSSRYVPCKNGVRRCHTTEKIVDGLHCHLTAGIKITDCTYEAFYKKGFPLITCRWQDEIGEMIPEHVDTILELPGRE